MLVSTIWIVSVFVASLKDFMSITLSFAVGMITAVLLMPWLGTNYGVPGMLASFNIGLLLIVFPLMALVFLQYGMRSNSIFAFTGYFRGYWELAASGFLYNFGIWIDKWIMWFAPGRVVHPSGMIYHPNYDTAMFLAYLSIVPSLALFVFSVETSFFKKYLGYFRDVLRHANFKKIQQNQQVLREHVFSNTRGFIVLQGSICFLAIILAPRLFDMFSVNYLQMGMFRLGVAGTLFQILSVFLMIVLSYFDDRKTVVLLQFLFVISNALLTIISMNMGFPYYGLGFLLASLLTFTVTAVVVVRYLREITFHAFITNNHSVVK
jgi:uncharacterized membrane protein